MMLLPTCRGAFEPRWAQVIDKDADGVLDEIESAIFQVAVSILDGRGFSYR